MKDITQFSNMTELLEYISNLPTPREFVETRQNTEYVKVEYMKYILNKYFRPWNWIINKSETIYENGRPLYEKVLATLRYYDVYGGTFQEVSMIAAHRIQYSTRNDERIITDPGNDTKAANTDTFKKVCNFALNIADDIYRGQTKITQKQKEEILELHKQGGFNGITEEELLEKIDSLQINKINFNKEVAGAKFRIRNKH